MLQPILFNIYSLLPERYSIIQSPIQIFKKKKKEKKKESENLSFHPASTKDEDEAQNR